MPKKIVAELERQLRQALIANYPIGSRFLSLAQICSEFQVSRKTAHKAITTLKNEGLIIVSPKSGIHVLSHSSSTVIKGKRLVIFSNLQHREFDDAILRGVESAVINHGVILRLVNNPLKNTQALSLGDYLLDLKCDGVIAISFGDASLGFYRAMREGLDIIADYEMPELPILPVVQADYYKYGELAGNFFRKSGKTKIMALGFPELSDSNCYQERMDGLHAGAKPAEVEFRCVSPQHSQKPIDQFLKNFSEEKALFSLELGANSFLESLLARHRITPLPNQIALYVASDTLWKIPGLGEFPCIGPSLNQLGQALGSAFIKRWQVGHFPSPPVELI